MLWWSPWWLAVYAGVVAGAVALWWLPWSLAAAAGGAAAVGVVVLWAVWWRFPRWQTDRLQIAEPKDRAGVEDNFRKTITQLIGGVAVLIGAGIAYYGTLQTLQGSRDLLVSQQISKGFEDLGTSGDDKLMVRLGGIYALEGVMNASEQYHQPALEALCAFVRDRTKDYKGDGPPATDIQAALTVIGRRKAGKGRVDLTGARVPRVVFFMADLADAKLGGAVLTNAQLMLTKLNGAYLANANLNGADLSLDKLAGAVLTNAQLISADLGGANLTGAELPNAKLNSAILVIADLTGAYLNGAYLANANLNGANLNGANLSDG